MSGVTRRAGKQILMIIEVEFRVQNCKIREKIDYKKYINVWR